MELFRSRRSLYRSSQYEIKRNLIRSRDRQRRRAERLRGQVEALEAENQRLRRSLKRCEEQLQLHTLAQETNRAASTEGDHPADRSSLSAMPIAGHHFAASMIALCIDLAKQVGFRPAQRALETMVKALKLDVEVPSHDAIRNWTSRLGLGELEDTFGQDQDVMWMADHSSQVGSERVLLIIGMAMEDLPERGQTLSLDKFKVLAVVPGERWKKEDVRREYQKLAARTGAPRYLLCDGATELRDPAEELEKAGRKTIVLGDLKHHAANILEKHIGRTERFKEFITQAGLTRNRVQQTELSPFAPPPLKQKSRFMNLDQLLRWAGMVNYHLDNPRSQAHAGVTADRMNEKLGWLRDYREELAGWAACQKVIDAALSFIHDEGLSVGAADRLRTRLEEVMPDPREGHEAVGRIAGLLVEFVERSERLLDPGERAWLSTEILESLFGRFKQLEGQHSKGGFTSLLAALPSFCCRIDPSRVRKRLLQVSTTKLKQWLQETIGSTLASQRAKAYQQYAAAQAG